MSNKLYLLFVFSLISSLLFSNVSAFSSDTSFTFGLEADVTEAPTPLFASDTTLSFGLKIENYPIITILS